MEWPDNWDRREAEYNLEYDPYDRHNDEDGGLTDLVHCKSCNAYIDFSDTRICHTHNKRYCVWCAHDSKHNCCEGGKCKVREDNGYPF